MAFNFAFYCNVCKIKAKKKGQEIEIKKGKECQCGWDERERGASSSNRTAKKEKVRSERERERKARLRGRVCSRYKHSCTSTCYNNNNNITQTVSERMNVKSNMPHVFSPFVLPFRLFVYMMAFILNSSTIWTSLNWHNLGKWHVRVSLDVFVYDRMCV